MFTRHDFIGEILGICTVVASFVVAWLLMGYQDFKVQPVSDSNSEIFYEVKPGTTLNALAVDFENRGWLANSNYLKVYYRLNEKRTLKAGEYRINLSSNIIQILEKIFKGEVILHQITLIEGWTFNQLLQALAENDKLTQTIAGLTDEQIMDKLGKAGLHPEGQFLPDTYKFARGTSDFEILKQAHNALENTLQKAWTERVDDLPLKTPYEALILASIVEKETGIAEERQLIAGVFISRLRKNMKLQTDPTVIYGMGERYKGNIKRKHLREDTPYNTYVHKGLTPTPISMPGRAAIEAVINPDEAGYLFFVAMADGTGRHYFSKTYKEHNKAVKKYQLKQK